MARTRQRLLGTAFGVALAGLLGATSGAPPTPAPAPSPAPAAPLARSRFDAPRGCRNLTLIGYPAAGFPRVLPLTLMCPFEPRTDCHGEALPQRSKLALREARKSPRRDTVKWRLKKGDATSPADLGDPTLDTNYELCVYVEVDGVCWLVLHPDALAGDGWTAKRDGFRFRAKKGAHPDGLQKLRVRAGADGKTRMVLRGRGRALGLRALPIPGDAAVLVQLYNDAGQCWSTEFGQDAVQSPTRFRDRSD